MNPNDNNPYQQPTTPQSPTTAPVEQSRVPQQPLSMPSTPNSPLNSQPPQNIYPGPANLSNPPQYPNSAPVAQKGMFHGRLNRIGFLLSFVYILVYFFIPLALELLLRGNAIVNIVTILFGIVGVVLVIPVGISVGVRRWHDLNQSGWLILLGLIPFVGFLLLIVYLFAPGTKVANNYGEVDNLPSTIGKVLFGN